MEIINQEEPHNPDNVQGFQNGQEDMNAFVDGMGQAHENQENHPPLLHRMETENGTMVYILHFCN